MKSVIFTLCVFFVVIHDVYNNIMGRKVVNVKHKAYIQDKYFIN